MLGHPDAAVTMSQYVGINGDLETVAICSRDDWEHRQARRSAASATVVWPD